MTTYLSKEVQAGLEAARKAALKRRNRLRVVMGDDRIPVLRLWDHGFAVEHSEKPRLRGFVDVYDGARHLWQCLIVAAAEDGDEMQYEFKRQTAALDGPALDFERASDAPAGFLPKA